MRLRTVALDRQMTRGLAHSGQPRWVAQESPQDSSEIAGVAGPEKAARARTFEHLSNGTYVGSHDRSAAAQTLQQSERQVFVTYGRDHAERRRGQHPRHGSRVADASEDDVRHPTVLCAPFDALRFGGGVITDDHQLDILESGPTNELGKTVDEYFDAFDGLDAADEAYPASALSAPCVCVQRGERRQTDDLLGREAAGDHLLAHH